MKQLLRTIVFIPNSPFTLVLSVYVVIKIWLEIGTTEFMMLEKEDIVNDRNREYVKKIYPQHLRVFVAVVIYSLITMNIILK